MMAAALDLQSLEQYCETLYNPSSQASRLQVETLLNYHFPTFSLSTGSSSTNPTAAVTGGGGGGVGTALSSGASRGGTGIGGGGDVDDDLDGTTTSAPHSPSVNSPLDSALFCRSLLENTKNPYALMFATSRLKTLVEDHFTSFTAPEQHGLRTFVLRYIYQNPDAEPFIITTQAQLFALITKLGWLENDEFRTLVDNMQVFLQRGAAHRIIGVRILAAVATEMNLTNDRHAVKFRKIAVSFRDTQLLPIFQCALSMLQASLQSQLSDPDAEKLKEAILILMRTCLSFDFIGTMPDESSDDAGSIQTPSSWRVVFEEPEYLDVLWDSWKVFASPASALVMESLSQAASIRRSLFSSDEARHKYIHHIMREIHLTLKTGAGQTKLQVSGNFHEFCRMLSKFRSTFQMSEMCSFSEFEPWIATVGEFSSRAIHSWKWSPNSIPYILTFWSKMVSSISSAEQSKQELIQNITVDLSRAYVKSRLECAQAAIDGEVDDPLESEEELVTGLEMFATVTRTKYVDSGRYILQEFKDQFQKYRETIQAASTMAGTTSPTLGSSEFKERLLMVEMKLTWLVYIIAACIGGRISYQSTAEQDQVDGELACEVLGFIHQLQIWTSQRPSYLATPDAHLYVQSSIIYFYLQFRSTYIGEDSSKSVKVYALLTERWGLNTPNQVLDIIMNSSLVNLRSNGDPEWKKQEDMLTVRTLKLYTNLASGYSSVKYIRKLDTTKVLLSNHSPSEFRFLSAAKKSSDTAVSRCRMNYYTMLSRVLFAEDNVDADFWRFVKPWEIALDQVTLALEGGGDLSEEDIRLILLGLFKDLRGFVISITNRKQYTLFFDWFYPAYTPIVRRAIEIWPHDELGIAILRFWHEFVNNKSNRIAFDSSSPNGILLFQETSSILFIYGQHLLSRPLSRAGSLWTEKYKGIMLYFNVLSASLSGKYVNFGVFKLYGDKALERILDIFFQLMLAIPVDDIIAYPKLSTAYYTVLDVFVCDHMMGLPMIPHPVLAYMFRALGEIIIPQSLDTVCCSLACSSIDKICSFVVNWMIKDKIRKDDEQEELHRNAGSPDPNGRPGSGSNSQRSSVEISRGPPHSGSSTNGLVIGPGSRPVSKRRQQQQQQQKETHWLVEYLMTHKDILSYLFLALFHSVAFENRSNYWSLSRPLLGVVLLNREFFVEYTNNLIQSQLPDRQEKLQLAVNALMEGIEFSLLTQTRDRFTQNITAFKRECAQMTLMSASGHFDDDRML